MSFKASDGTMLRGWLFATERRGAPFVLYFYGSNEDAQLEQKRMTWLSTVGGVNAVVFDYRAMDSAKARSRPEAMRTDAVGAFDAVRQIAGGAPIILYGWSIGTTFAIHVAAERAAAGVLLQAPPASAAEMAAWSSQHDVPAAVRWAVNLTGDADYNATFRGAAEISRVKAPLLVIHGDKDEDVPLAQGQEVFANSPSTAKKFVIVPGGRHNDIRISLPPAAPAIMEFFKAVATEAGGSP